MFVIGGVKGLQNGDGYSTSVSRPASEESPSTVKEDVEEMGGVGGA